MGSSRAIAFSVALIGPTFAAAVIPPLVIARAGTAAPIAFAVAGILMALVAVPFVRFSLRIATEGSVIAFVGEAFGPRLGFVAGWTLLLAYLGSASGTAAITVFELTRLWPALGSALPWQTTAILVILLGLAASIREIKTAATLLAGLELVATLVILAVVYSVLSHPSRIAAIAATADDPWSGVGSGTLFAVMALAGFEGAAVLGRETLQPTRAIPRAIGGSLLAATIFFILLAEAEIVGFGPSGLDALTRSAAPLQDLASRSLAPQAGVVLDAAIVGAAFSLLVVCLTASSRLLLTLAKMIGLDFLSRLSMRRASPVRATIGVAAIALLPIAFCRSANQQDFNSAVVTIATIGFILAYMLVTAAGATDTAKRGRWLTSTLDLLATAFLAWPLWSNLYPVPAWPTDLWPCVDLGWLLCGALLTLQIRRDGIQRIPANS